MGSGDAFSQDATTSGVKRFRINEFQLLTGTFLSNDYSVTLDEFRQLAPNSEVLKSNFAGYSSYNGANFMSNRRSTFSALLGIQLSNKDKSGYMDNPLLRVGVSYISGQSFSRTYYNSQRKAFDTFISSQTGEMIFRDSVDSHSAGMTYSSDQLRIDASFIYRTNPQARWSLSAGFGVSAGVSISARTRVYEYNGSYTEIRYPNYQSYSSYYFMHSSGEEQEYRNKANFGASAYIPLGVNFRIGKNREFWKRVNLFYEMRPGISISSVPELRTETAASMQQGLGLRVTW